MTYERSREARREESRLPDQYERVYDAERPEVFFKSAGRWVRGSGQPVGIRADSTWDVPEPELALVVNSTGVIVGYSIGNDMSSRSIEGENALYLPQAKYYTGACALGPCIVPAGAAPPPSQMTIALRIRNQQHDVPVRITSWSETAEEIQFHAAWEVSLKQIRPQASLRDRPHIDSQPDATPQADPPHQQYQQLA